MKYDRRTIEHLFRDLSKMSMKVELGLQGEITGEFIPCVLAEFFRSGRREESAT